MPRRVILLLVLLCPSFASAQVFVIPRRAQKSQVRHFEYDWKHIDIAYETGDAAKDSSGAGVRLYFYAREEKVAERAAGLIGEAYRYLAERFDYVPQRKFPYILYNTYHEFLETNLFPLQEGVLGVTSPIDLTLTLPYFGDHKLFTEVGTHELAHQFTIQKLRTLSTQQNSGDPLGAMPLWFIEGLAEFYAHHGMDNETEMLARDMVVSPSVYEGYALSGFFEDRPGDVLWTYKLGQARCTFLEETYGEGTLQRILQQSPTLVSTPLEERMTTGSFPRLLERVTGASQRQIAGRFEQWLKHRAFGAYLDARNTATEVEPLEGIESHVNALATSPNGELLAYRSMDYDTGISRLIVVDYRDPSVRHVVAADGVPQVESLHPISGRNFDVANNAVAFVAEADGADVLYWQDLVHSRRSEDIDVDLGKRAGFDMSAQGIIALDAPAFSPDGKQIAFIGLGKDGVKDLWVLDRRTDKVVVRRMTHDAWAERSVSWGSSGIAFSSDATGHGKYNVFLVDPEDPELVERLTTEAVDQFDVRATTDGRIFFGQYTDARADVHEIVANHVIRRTSVATGLFDASPAPDGDLWALWHSSGRRTVVRLRKASLLTSASRPIALGDSPRVLPQRSLAGAQEYNSLSLDNWRVGNIFGVLGVGGGIFGQLYASATDRLHNHVLVLNLSAFGRAELTDGFLLYMNQVGWNTWGTGPFQSLSFRLDRTFNNRQRLSEPFTSVERFYGLLGLLRYPFNTFQYVEGEVALGGVKYFLHDASRTFLASPGTNGAGRNLLAAWEELNGGTRLQGQAALRFGYDTIRYHRDTGPLAGSSLLVEATGTIQPTANEHFESLRLDGSRYFPIASSANIFLRGGAGGSFGGRLARQYYLSSYDTLRGVPFGKIDYLLGKYFVYSTLELQFPLNAIIRVLFFPSIEGVLGADFGMVHDDLDTIWEKRVADAVVGMNFGLGPLVLRMHFAKPLNIGARPRRAGMPTNALPANGDWITNLSLSWMYL